MERNSARLQCQEAVASFIADLEIFATGSYLADSEKELWDQPFDPAAIPHVEAALQNFLDAVDALARLHPALPADEVQELAVTTIDELESINAQFAWAVLEPEEYTELNELFSGAFRAVGVAEETLGSLPILE